MQPSFLSDAENWILIAREDLRLAALAVAQEPVIGGGAVFHAQQAAEKALKAFLFAFGQPTARTHELGSLLSACIAIDPLFATFQRAAQTLNPYVSRFRYPLPGVPLQPTDQEISDALISWSDIVVFVERLLFPSLDQMAP